MTKEERDKIIKTLKEERNNYAREREKEMATELGKITGADYMIQRFLDIFKTVVEPSELESEECLF